MKAKRLRGHGALRDCCIDTYRASVHFTPLSLSFFPLFSFLSPHRLLPMTLFHYTYFFKMLQTLVMDLAYRQELYLLWLLGRCRTGNGLIVWWKENKTRAIKDNWNISSCCSTSVPSIFSTFIGSGQIKRKEGPCPLPYSFKLTLKKFI